MGECLPEDLRKYIIHHLKDDAEHHLSMTTPKYQESHSIMWGIIDWETWVKLMKAQAGYSEKAAELIGSIDTCEEIEEMKGRLMWYESGGKPGEY